MLHTPQTSVRREVVRSPFADYPATTFGKTVRSTGALTTTMAGTLRAQTPQFPEPALYSSFKRPDTRCSAWAAKQHHVVFRGDGAADALMTKLSLKAVESSKYTSPLTEQFNAEHVTTVRASRKSSDSQKKMPPLLFGEVPVDRPLTTPELVFRCGHLMRHRNIYATDIDGRPVSTFGGPPREVISKGPLADRNWPGPGHYHKRDLKKKKAKSLLKGGIDGRGELVMTRSGLISELPPPKAKPKETANLSSWSAAVPTPIVGEDRKNADSTRGSPSRGGLRSRTPGGFVSMIAPAPIAPETFNVQLRMQVERRQQLCQV